MAVRRVLVVEDHEDGSESLRLLLKLSGYDVRVARSGTDGVAQAHEWLPDAVLCDIGLPGLDGFGVARAIRGGPATAHIPLLGMSGYGTEAVRRQAEESGFSVLFTKPIDPDILLEVLQHAEGLLRFGKQPLTSPLLGQPETLGLHMT